MNKLEGFYALNDLRLPTVPWKQYKKDTVLDDSILWTIRSAVVRGDDLNLPRKIGVSASEADSFAKMLLNKLGANDLIIYYPFFIALKSGVIDISNNRIVIEAVAEDLWNLVTYNKKNVTIIITDNDTSYVGDKEFLSETELNELLKFGFVIKRTFRDEICSGRSVLLEWSYSMKSDLNKRPIGEKKLVFYEVRTV
ncbi:hypothetical protein [Ruminococcus sp.]|uniref:hypothetical protein n=1 Tax=Ruminococcus sp. TaxID=41978 RepID=UPI001B4C047A|nr:hypothetical protein [Ruminococcus sp.]MBP5431393.1 hypothetical protein [Ruminococcus sp.]